MSVGLKRIFSPSWGIYEGWSSPGSMVGLGCCFCQFENTSTLQDLSLKKDTGGKNHTSLIGQGWEFHQCLRKLQCIELSLFSIRSSKTVLCNRHYLTKTNTLEAYLYKSTFHIKPCGVISLDATFQRHFTFHI